MTAVIKYPTTGAPSSTPVPRGRWPTEEPIGMIVMIPISSIHAGTGGIDFQSKTRVARVASLVKALNEGADIPPITVFQVFEKRYLLDGRHRLRAHKVAGRTEIAADLIHVRNLAHFRIEKAKVRRRMRQLIPKYW